MSKSPPRILIIGAGSRGNSYARAIVQSTNGVVASVAEPIASKRKHLGQRYIWGLESPREGEEFEDWRDFVEWETDRRAREAKGEDVPKPVDGVFVCTLDETHVEIIVGLSPLNLHIMSEKPLATSLKDCLNIYNSILAKGLEESRLFAVGHVLRYSPHNILLRKLLLEEEAIGEIVSIVHTEQVGWWHFAHSYVRFVILYSFIMFICFPYGWCHL
jgi:predicted dehydrogenase